VVVGTAGMVAAVRAAPAGCRVAMAGVVARAQTGRAMVVGAAGMVAAVRAVAAQTAARMVGPAAVMASMLTGRMTTTGPLATVIPGTVIPGTVIPAAAMKMPVAMAGVTGGFRRTSGPAAGPAATRAETRPRKTRPGKTRPRKTGPRPGCPARRAAAPAGCASGRT
jgi:hypothetical protein